MDELVERLSQGRHPVEVSLRPEKSAAALKECIDRGYVHIRFTQTRGGTEVGVTLDRSLTNVDHASFEQQNGTVRLAGSLVLNYTPVRCSADIDLATLAGTGNLEPIGA